MAERAFDGESTFIEDFRLEIERFDQPEEAFFTFCYSPLRLRDGLIGGMLDTVMETTATVRAKEDLSAANEELAHRLKNSLAMVTAIASQTLRTGTAPEVLKSFNKRIQALAHAHDVLLRQSWTAVSLRQVLADALDILGACGNIATEGPDLAIGSRTTMMLSLLLHELSTNAAKCGSMSRRGGRIEICWQIAGERFEFQWRERGGPEVSPPTRQGFGTRLIKRSLGPSAKVEMRFEPAGFELDASLMLAEMRH